MNTGTRNLAKAIEIAQKEVNKGTRLWVVYRPVGSSSETMNLRPYHAEPMPDSWIGKNNTWIEVCERRGMTVLRPTKTKKGKRK